MVSKSDLIRHILASIECMYRFVIKKDLVLRFTGRPSGVRCSVITLMSEVTPRWSLCDAVCKEEHLVLAGAY